jgi:transposase
MVMDEITEEPGALVERVAALDIGKATLTVCVRVPDEGKPGARRQEVRTYATLTPALLELRDWLICQGVTLVVMEATSAYWKPPFYLLEDDIECWVVNARDVKNVPGRAKTDPLTELPGEVRQVSGRMGVLVATVADHDHRRRCAAGPVPAGDAAGRVA